MIGRKGDTGLIISCDHVFDGGVRQPYVIFNNGYKAPATVVGRDRQLDLSAMIIRAPAGIGTPKGVRAARPDDKVFMAVGFPWYSQGGQNYTIGAYLGYSGFDVQFNARPYVHSGFSGGALITQEGYFVGVVCGYGQGYSYASSGDGMVRFIDRWMETIQ